MGLQYCENEELLFNKFFNNLLSFMEEPEENDYFEDTPYSKIDSVDGVVTSGNFESFSTRFSQDLVYQKSHFGNNVSTTWTNSALGLRSSVKLIDDSSSSQDPTVVLMNKKRPIVKKKKPGICQFCFKNGEPKIVYSAHILKSLDGLVVCPTLRRYVCNLCGATGSYSHTRKYCPKYIEMLGWQEYYQNYVSMVQ